MNVWFSGSNRAPEDQLSDQNLKEKNNLLKNDNSKFKYLVTQKCANDPYHVRRQIVCFLIFTEIKIKFSVSAEDFIFLPKVRFKTDTCKHRVLLTQDPFYK